MHDAIIIGGSFAGLSAALQLARTRRSVLVLDSGKPRNRFAQHSHGFLGQDHRPPADILATARQQLARYSTARIVEAAAIEARETAHGFEIATDGDETFAAARLVIATGLVDTLPDVAGLTAEWGRSVFQCPYCDGYEIGGGPIGVLAVSRNSLHQMVLLSEWGEVTVFLNGAFAPTDEERADLAARRIAVEEAPVAAWTRDANGQPQMQMADGRHIGVKALFTATRTTQASPVAEQLGCAMEDGLQGPLVKVDGMQATSVPNVFAAGDAARAMHSVAFAVSSGALAGIAAHRSLVFAAAA